MAFLLDKNFGYVDRRRVERDVGRHRRCYETHRLASKKMMKLQSMMKRWSWIAWLLLSTSWVTWGLAYLVNPGPPLSYGPVRVDTPFVVSGAFAHFVYSISRNRTCPARINGFWINTEGEAIKRMEPVPGGYGKVGNVQTPVAIQTPNDYIGPLCYRAHTFHSCEDANYVTISPDACVTVVKQ